MKILLFTGCDDGYLHLLLDMMESLGDQLQKYDFGLLDLGLSDESKVKIQKLKPDVIIKKPQWFIDLPEWRKTPFAQACSSRPFIKKIFPDYDGYMQIDTDLWFLDNSVIDDYIKAAEATGFSITADVHDRSGLTFYKVHSKRHWLIGKKKFKKITSWAYPGLKNLFGHEIAMELVLYARLNAGFYFMHANSPVWEAWQKAIKLVDWHKVKKKQVVCDQTCLFYAVYKLGVPHQPLTIHHNWVGLAGKGLPLFDKNAKVFVDPTYPHTKVKVIHIGGVNIDRVFDVETTDGDFFKSKVTRTEFLKNI